MSKRTLIILSLVFATSLAPVLAAESPPDPASVRTGVIVDRGDRQLTLWTGEDEEVVTLTTETEMPMRPLESGNLIWAQTQGPDSSEAQRIILIDDEISVIGRVDREHAVIGDSWEAQSPSQLVVRSATDQEIFVISPETFRQPLPKKGERVAVIYRVEETQPPRYVATGLITLPAGLEHSPVKITYSDVPRAEEQVAASPQPTAAAEAEEMETEPTAAAFPRREATVAELPRTARQTTPLVFALGLLMVGAGLACRSFAR
jgi:hypothetical protein